MKYIFCNKIIVFLAFAFIGIKFFLTLFNKKKRKKILKFCKSKEFCEYLLLFVIGLILLTLPLEIFRYFKIITMVGILIYIGLINKNKNKYFLKYFLFFISLIALDASFKYWVLNYIPKMSFRYPFYPYEGIGVFKNFLGISFSIVHVENTGAAWGIFAKYPVFLFCVRIAIAIGLVVYFARFNKDEKKDFPLFLIVTGALGNIFDFCLYRKVIDMFYFNFWGFSYPVFNLADVMITSGIIWLFLACLKKKEKVYEN